MTLEDVKRKGMVSELVRRLSKAEDDLRKLLIKSPALPGARVYGNANQSIGNNSNTALNFTTSVYDQAEFWNVANPSRLTIAIPGIYDIRGIVRFAPNATGGRAIGIVLNGVVSGLSWTLVSGLATYDCVIGVSTLYPLVAGDYVEIYAWQVSGGNLNSLTDGVNSPLAMIQRVS